MQLACGAGQSKRGWIVLAYSSRAGDQELAGVEERAGGGEAAGGRSLGWRGRAASRVPEKENDKDPISAAVGFIGQAL